MKNSFVPLPKTECKRLGWVRSVLSYGSVTRRDHGAVFTCAASNTNLTAPSLATATLKLKCK